MIRDPFWKHIAKAIEKEEGVHPSDQEWNKKRIEVFRFKMTEKLRRILQSDQEKANLCVTDKDREGKMKERINLSNWEVTTYYTFLRIFRSGESTGQPNVRNQFAIYFGSESYEDYMIRHSIESSRNLKPKSTKAEMKKKKGKGKVQKIKKQINNVGTFIENGKNLNIINNQYIRNNREEE